MNRSLAALPLLALIACAAEPGADGVELGSTSALLDFQDLTLKDLLLLERCENGVDDDHDGLTDEQPCVPLQVLKDKGFVGGSMDGTGISDPFGPEDGATQIDGQDVKWVYEPGDGETPTALWFLGKKMTAEIDLVGEHLDGFYQTRDGEGGGETSIVVVTTDAVAYQAEGPLDGNLYVQGKGGEHHE
jgi:hypothetical protein